MSSFTSSLFLAFFAIITLISANELTASEEAALAKVTLGLARSFQSGASLAAHASWKDPEAVQTDVYITFQVTEEDPTNFVHAMIDEYNLLPKQISPSMVLLELDISLMTDICMLTRQSAYTSSKGMTSHDVRNRHAAFMEIAHFFGQYGEAWYLKYGISNFTSKTQEDVYHEWSSAFINKCENVNGRFSQELARGQDHQQGLELFNEIKDEVQFVKDELTKATEQLSIYLPFFEDIQNLLENMNGTVVEVREGVRYIVGQNKYAMDKLVKLGINTDTLQGGMDQLHQKVDNQTEVIGKQSEVIRDLRQIEIEQSQKLDSLVQWNWVERLAWLLVGAAQFLYTSPVAVGYITGGWALFRPCFGRCWNKIKSCCNNDSSEFASTDAEIEEDMNADDRNTAPVSSAGRPLKYLYQ